ncbi:MAG: hypothetical protein NTV93_17345 [Verrucomicrobia bacterium]|nr:hypothetical protein [Verrucomicrobiota bacterium]
MSLAALESAIRRRLDVVADHALRDSDPAAHLEALKAAHRELESRVAALPPGTDPRLLHFLERQSYEKAVAFLAG